MSISIAPDFTSRLFFCSWFLGEMTADKALNFMKERAEIKTFAVYKNLDNNTYTFAFKSNDSIVQMRIINSCESKYQISGEVSQLLSINQLI